MKKRITLLVIGMVLLTSVSGCAFGTRHPVLGYEVITTPQPAKDIDIYIAKFKDVRMDKDVIGHVRNGFGMRTAKIITETNIADWVTDALKSEFNNIGYTVVDNPNTDVKISGEIIEVYVTSLMMYEGKTVIEITLNIDGKEVFTRKYRGSDESMNWAARAESYGITLERSLQQTLREAAYDIDRAVSKK